MIDVLFTLIFMLTIKVRMDQRGLAPLEQQWQHISPLFLQTHASFSFRLIRSCSKAAKQPLSPLSLQAHAPLSFVCCKSIAVHLSISPKSKAPPPRSLLPSLSFLHFVHSFRFGNQTPLMNILGWLFSKSRW